MIELSSEDALRLNVLLANDIQALRIDESRMTVHGLTETGETTIRLNPTGRDEPYLRQVRELISTQVLGSPGGYPVYLKRWTRMGQARDGSLERLLMLGEPEAVVAVVHAGGLNCEIARRAWWAMPSAENARRMLQRRCVVEHELGRELAEYLIEYLPFETEPRDMIETVRLVLQPGLVDEAERMRIWAKARHKNTYYVGFLQALPDDLPEPVAAHPEYPRVAAALSGLVESGNAYAELLCRILSAPGQTFIHVVETVLSKPANQEVVVALLNTVNAYFAAASPEDPGTRDIGELAAFAASACADENSAVAPALAAVLRAVPEFRGAVAAMIVLSFTDEHVVTPVFARTDAIGTLMRRKIEPVVTPIKEQFARLRGSGS